MLDSPFEWSPLSHDSARPARPALISRRFDELESCVRRLFSVRKMFRRATDRIRRGASVKTGFPSPAHHLIMAGPSTPRSGALHPPRADYEGTLAVRRNAPLLRRGGAGAGWARVCGRGARSGGRGEPRDGDLAACGV